MLDIKPLIKDKRCKKFRADQPINGAGASGRAMYFLLDGSVSAFKDGARSYISPLMAFGGHEYFNGGRTVYTAETDSSVYVITEDSFGRTAKKHPAVLYEILKAAYCTPDMNEGEDAKAFSQTKAATEAEKPFRHDDKAEMRADRHPPLRQEHDKNVETTVSPPAKTVTPQAIRAQGEVYPQGHKSYPGIVYTEYEKLVYKKNYKCPNCSKTFDDYKVFKSKLTYAEPLRYDLKSCFNGFKMEWYEIVTCPHCLFSMFHNYFTEPKPLLKEKLNAALDAAKKDIRMNFIAQRDVDYVFSAHYLALACANGYTSPRRHIIAKIWANLSWLYEDVGDGEMARFAAGECALAYDELFANSNLSMAQEQSISLIIAGMMYRAGKRDNIKKYLFIAKTSKAGNKTYANLADDLWEVIRAEA